MRNTPLSQTTANGLPNLTTAWFPADQWFAFSAIANGTGTIAGTMKVQVSNDSPGTAQGAIAGQDLPGAAVTLSTLKGVIPYTNSAYNWVRLVFTSSGGTGGITMTMKASGV